VIKVKKQSLLIGIRSLDQLGEETKRAFRRLTQGLPPEQPINRLYFEDTATLFKSFTPKRMELLRMLRQHGPISIRQLASKLSRDYRNVYDDIQHLLDLDLVKKNRQGLFHVPWSNITIELSLAA
jgi:predicted transcriptional regulator